MFKVVAGDKTDRLRQIRLKSCLTLKQAEEWRPKPSVLKRLLSMGYGRLEICPRNWAHTAGGYKPFATLKLKEV